MFCKQKKLLTGFFFNIFVELAWHYPVPDWFDQHFQPSVQFPLTSSVNKSQQHQNKFLGTPRIEPEAAEWDAKILPLCYAAPLKPKIVFQWKFHQLKLTASGQW